MLLILEERTGIMPCSLYIYIYIYSHWYNQSTWLKERERESAGYSITTRTLTSTITPVQSEIESKSNVGVLHIPRTHGLESHYQMQFNVITKTLNGFKYCYQTLIILFNIYSFICSQLNGFKCSKLLYSSIWPIDGTRTYPKTLDQSGIGSNGNERVLHILESFRTRISPSDTV